MKRRKPMPTRPSTPVTRATISAGRRRAQKATAAPHHPSVTVQKRIEPSWEPQVAATL